MKLRLGLLLILALGVRQACAAQGTPAPDAGETPASDVTTSPPPQAQAPAPASVPAPASPQKGFYWEGWKRLGPNLLYDQKKIWLFPVSVAKGRHLKPTLALVGVTAALIAVDKYPETYFHNTQSFAGFNRVFSGPHTALAMEIMPAAFYAIGLARRDQYAQKTFVLALETVADSEILTTVMKDIDRRSVPPDGDYSDTWFAKKTGSFLKGVGSFPSGHTIAAFSVATIFADRYPNPRWHVWLAYGLATLVGFSRVSWTAHYVSDVFAGATLGYVIGHYVVEPGR